MGAIERQVALARRRLLGGQILRSLPAALSIPLLAVLVPLAIPKIWEIGVDPIWWRWGWICGAIAVGLIAAAVWTGRNYPSALDAAVEIDRRFRLKERISSSYSLPPTMRETPIGTALYQDADRRVANIEIPHAFPLQGTWRQLLPLMTFAAAMTLAFLFTDARVRATQSSAVAAGATIHSAEVLKKQAETKRRELEEKGLHDAAKLMTKIEHEADAISRKDVVDRKSALIKLNDLTKEVKARQAEVGDLSKLKRQLDQLKEIPNGPADKLAKSLRQGDFKTGMQALKELRRQLNDGKLNDQQKSELRKQLQSMAKELQALAQRQQEAKQSLEKEIEQAKQAGDYAKAGMLQDKLDALNQLNNPTRKAQRLAQQMSNAAKQMEAGNDSEASKSMAQMEQELESMAKDESELQTLNEALEKLGDCKDCMQCENCNGKGCSECEGLGNLASQSNSDSSSTGKGLGKGRGQGDRPETEEESKMYDSQVRGKVRDGKGVKVGTADGPNQAGDSVEEIRQAVESARSDEEDPLTNVRLPRGHRDYVRQYFDAVREGDSP